MNITILTVDTDYTRTLLNSKLEEQNHTVVAGTNNYKKALELYSEFLPDIIILDIDLGSTSEGLDFLDKLLDFDPYAQIITLSTLFKNTTRARLFKKGIDRLVMKPYQPAHIWEQIDDISMTKDIKLLRQQREEFINEQVSKVTTNKGEQFNQQILSLRDQISRSRNNTDIIEKSYDKDINLEFKDTNSLENNTYVDDYDFDIDFDFSLDNSSEYSVDIYKTQISDNSNIQEISLYDNNVNYDTTCTTSYTDTYQKYDEANKECAYNNSYLGLDLFIDRDQRIDYTESDHNNTYIPNKEEIKPNSATVFSKILKRKGENSR